MPAEVRRAGADDLPLLTDLLELYYAEWDIWQRDTQDQVLEYLSHPSLGFLLAELDSVPVGCVLLRTLPGIPRAAECKRLFVTPLYRGHGLAGELMQRAEDLARSAGLDWIYLDTKAEFSAAIALYRKRGYQNVPRFNDNAQATIFLSKGLR